MDIIVCTCVRKKKLWKNQLASTNNKKIINGKGRLEEWKWKNKIKIEKVIFHYQKFSLLLP